jgi:hypothetical protein
MPYLWGRKFKLITGHQDLIWARKLSDASAKVTRLKLKLAGFEYAVVYKAGKVERIAGVPEENLGDESEALEGDGETTDL